MAEAASLRERKKERTRQALSSAAISLFLERGFDQVSVADVAAAAEVSKPTLFSYFASKEDLALHRIADHHGEAARVVAGRTAGQAPLAALHEHFLAGLEQRDPVTGLNDHPEVLAYHRMVFSTPSLLARVSIHVTRDEEALAAALRAGTGTGGDPLLAALAAGQVVAVQRVLARHNWQQLIEGRTAADLHPEAVAAADQAFGLLRNGLGEFAAPSA